MNAKAPNRLASISGVLLALFVLSANADVELPSTAAGSSLLQTDVQRLVHAAPAIQQRITELNPPEPTGELKKTLAIAVMKGSPFSAMAEYLNNTDTGDALDDTAAAHGYDNFLHYADRADAAMRVLTAERWIFAARNIGQKKAPIANLWQYIHDADVDADERKKLSDQLLRMLDKFGSSEADAEMVYNNIDTLRPALTLGR